MVTADDIGARVSLRRRVGGTAWSEAVGVLLRFDDERIDVLRRDGSVTVIPRAEVVAAKVVPTGVLDLEEAAARCWLPADHTWLGRWLLRAAEGFTGRANSVLPLGRPDRPTGETLARVTSWYADRELPARFQLPLPAAGSLDRELAARGWPAYNPTVVMTARSRDVASAPARGALPEVQLRAEPSPEWLAAYHYRGAAELPAVGRQLMLSAPAQAFAEVAVDGVVAAIGRVAAAEHWAGITAMEVQPEQRRRGLGGHVLRALAGWALAANARGIWLQVAEDNAGARALYAGAGFTDHHRYHYRVADPA